MERFEQRAFEVFNRRFEEILPNCKNQREAFERVSDEIEEESEIRVYNSLEVFKNARSRNKRKARNENRA